MTIVKKRKYHWEPLHVYRVPQKVRRDDIQHSVVICDTQHQCIEGRFAECRDYLHIMPSVVMLNVVMLNVDMLSVVAPKINFGLFHYFLSLSLSLGASGGIQIVDYESSVLPLCYRGTSRH